MGFKSLKDFDFKGKTALVRADLNVPTKDGQITDTTRIDRVRPSIDYLVAQGARIIILSHFGRPKGQVVPEMSLSFLPAALTASWEHDVAFAATNGEISADNQITLLENLRFNPGETANDSTFAQKLASLGDIYVNDAFSTSHRAHASTEGIAHILPSCAGLLMQAELDALGAALEKPERPVAAIVGGAKISTKLELLENLVEKTDFLVLGGGMANTFLYAQGVDVKKSLCENDMADQARAIIDKAKQVGCELILPVDGVAATEFAENAAHVICDAKETPDNHMILDVGPQTQILLEEKLAACKTILWNGPMGAFEIAPFDKGTIALACYVAEKTKAGDFVSVAGGGDTVAALEHAGAASDFTYISTAGGAFLEWLEGKTLPGVAALMKVRDAA